MTRKVPTDERPLDDVLGRPTHVAILREVCTADDPVWRSDLPRRTGFSRSGIWLGIERLVAAGLLRTRQYWKAGLQATVEVDPGHPLAEAIRALFEREREADLENRDPWDPREEKRRFLEYLDEVVARAREGR